MRDSNIRIVQVVTVLVFVAGAVFAGISLFSPNAVAQVSAVTTEASRDINKSVMAPVKYVYNGTEYSELAPVKATAGETVTIAVNSEGYPTSRTSWLSAIAITACFVSLATLVGLIIAMIFGMSLEERYERRRLQRIRNHYYANQ